MFLDPSKANGPDGNSAQMLKGTAHNIAPSLTKLFNISISQGHFPECWKTSSVPIPKSANRSEATDYRPISLVSKMLEHHFRQCVTKHVSLKVLTLKYFRLDCNSTCGPKFSEIMVRWTNFRGILVNQTKIFAEPKFP